MKIIQMTTRVYNFSAGPAMLPEPILKAAQAELLDWHSLGMSVMEISHRSADFKTLMSQAEQQLRALLSIPSNYHVLFLGGAARTQFAMIPMNLLQAEQQAAYIVSGVWSSMAFDEACKLKQAYCVASSAATKFTTLPQYAPHDLQPETAYLYFTPNETINGVRFSTPPASPSIPLVADMTSCLLTEPICVKDYGLIFAGAQKNIGPAGLTIVIVRQDLIKHPSLSVIPTMLDYRTHAAHASLYATPPTFNCYMALKMFDWIHAQGGVNALYEQNKAKAARLYQAIDSLASFECRIENSARSMVNVCFQLTEPEREAAFLQQAEQRGLYGLKGHRLVGGLRASLYNAMPMAGVDALIDLMRVFSK
jgi:phosphoserine aminotransferase